MKRNCVVFPIDDKRTALRMLRHVVNYDKVIVSSNEQGLITVGITDRVYWYGVRLNKDKQYELIMSNPVFQTYSNIDHLDSVPITGFIKSIHAYEHQVVKVNASSPIYKSVDHYYSQLNRNKIIGSSSTYLGLWLYEKHLTEIKSLVHDRALEFLRHMDTFCDKRGYNHILSSKSLIDTIDVVINNHPNIWDVESLMWYVISVYCDERGSTTGLVSSLLEPDID